MTQTLIEKVPLSIHYVYHFKKNFKSKSIRSYTDIHFIDVKILNLYD